jgi:hypothetical protein
MNVIPPPQTHSAPFPPRSDAPHYHAEAQSSAPGAPGALGNWEVRCLDNRRALTAGDVGCSKLPPAPTASKSENKPWQLVSGSELPRSPHVGLRFLHQPYPAPTMLSSDQTAREAGSGTGATEGEPYTSNSR